MASPPFPPRPPPTRPHGGGRGHSRVPPNTPVRPPVPPSDAPRTPRSILRPTLPTYVSTPQNPTANPQIAPPQAPPIPRSTTSPYHHHHTSSSPELRPRADNAWAPRVRPYFQQPPSDQPQTGNAPPPTRPSSYIVQRPRADQDDVAQRRTGLAARVSAYDVPGIRGRSASDVRIAHNPPPDLDPDRLARACGQPALTSVYHHDDRGRQGAPVDAQSSRLNDLEGADAAPSHPPLPKARVSHMYRRLDALARRSGRRAMDYVNFEDVAVIHRRDNQLREQLRRKRSERLQEKDPSFHAIGAPLEDVLLYASTHIVIGDYQYHLPIVVVACVEELTKTGIYQSGLFRALPNRDRHLQLIDLFDKSSDFGANFNMRGQSMPDICALLSTFISSLPGPLLDSQIYAALWNWSVKPSVKREDARRDRQEEEEEERRARGESPHPGSWTTHNDFYFDDADMALENDQISITQILLRFLPSANLSLLVYLCGFFTQLPLCPENGLQLEDVARIFGHRLLGGSTKVVSQRMMMWLLTRWHRISDTLFGEACGMTPPSSPQHTSHPGSAAIAGEGSERTEKRKGKRMGGSDDAVCRVTSSSSSHSSSPTDSLEDHGVSSRKSSSDGEEEGGESSGGSRRRKKRELDVPESHGNAHASRPPTARKETRHGHGHGRRGSGSRRHHHGHSSEHKNTPSSPDPFAIAFAKAKQELADSPLLTNPSGIVASREGGHVSGDVGSQLGTGNLQRLDTPLRVTRFDEGSGRTNVDTRVVDTLLHKTAVATDTAMALAERVDVLEKALQVQRGEKSRVERLAGIRDDVRGAGKGGDSRNVDKRSNGDMEDGLRLQLRLVEAERDKAQRKLRDMRAYLLGEESRLQ